jgi:hypothetical protein
LQRSFGDFLSGQPYELRPENDAERHRFVCRIFATKPVPNVWSLMVGDVIHASRSALDNLTYSLAAKSLGGPPSPKQARGIQFPISETADEFHGTREKRPQKAWISLLSDEARAAIELLQPYQTPSPAKPHPLSVLRELANIDKHRHILLTGATLRPLSVIVRNTTGGFLSFAATFSGPFEEGAIGCVFPDTNVDISPDGAINMSSDIAVDVAFGLGPPMDGASVRPELLRIHDHIVDVVFPTLEPLL